MEEGRERERNDEHGGEEEKKKRGRGMWIIRRRRTSGSDGRKVIESSVYYLGRWNERECMRTSMWYGGSGGKMVFCVCSREKRRTTIAGILACARHTRFPHLSSPSPPLFLFLSRTLEGLSLGATARESLESHAGGTWPERGQLTHVHVVRVSYYMLHVTDVPFHWQRRNRRIGCSHRRVIRLFDNVNGIFFLFLFLFFGIR